MPKSAALWGGSDCDYTSAKLTVGARPGKETRLGARTTWLQLFLTGNRLKKSGWWIHQRVPQFRFRKFDQEQTHGGPDAKCRRRLSRKRIGCSSFACNSFSAILALPGMGPQKPQSKRTRDLMLRPSSRLGLLRQVFSLLRWLLFLWLPEIAAVVVNLVVTFGILWLFGSC